MYPYTVGPTEFVIAFFKEFVLKRTCKKSVSMMSDVRVQIGLRNTEAVEEAESSLSLIQSNV